MSRGFRARSRTRAKSEVLGDLLLSSSRAHKYCTAHSIARDESASGTTSSVVRVRARPRYVPMRSSVQPRLSALRAMNFSRGRRLHRSLDLISIYVSDQLWLRMSVLAFSRRHFARPCDHPLAPLDGDSQEI